MDNGWTGEVDPVSIGQAQTRAVFGARCGEAGSIKPMNDVAFNIDFCGRLKVDATAVRIARGHVQEVAHDFALKRSAEDRKLSRILPGGAFDCGTINNDVLTGTKLRSECESLAAGEEEGNL